MEVQTMHPSVAKLFQRIQNSDNHALAELAMLLEQSAHPERQDEAWQILPGDLFGMQLSVDEIKVVMDHGFELMASKKLSREAKMSLIKTLTLNADANRAEPLLRFFSEFADTFTEQDAFSFTACLGLYFQGIEDLRRISRLMFEYKTIELLQTFKKHDSNRVGQSSVRILNYLKKRGMTISED